MYDRDTPSFGIGDVAVECFSFHYYDVIMGAMASQITSLTIVYSAGNLPGNDEFPAQMASNAENVFIWWRHHVDLHRKPVIQINCISITTTPVTITPSNKLSLSHVLVTEYCV